MKPPTGLGWSACCATVRDRHSLVDRLKQRGADLVYRCGKGHTEPMQSDKYSGELVLTPMELINRIAQLIAATAHASASVLWRLGPELATERGGHGYGASGAGVGASACASAASASSRELPYGCAPKHRSPNRAASQTQTPPIGALSVGGTDRPYLRGVPPDLPQLRGADAHHKRSSLSAPTFTGFWSTSGWSQRPRASHRHAGHRCGMTLVRRSRRSGARGWMLSQTGMP